MSVRGGAVRGHGGSAARRALLLVPRLPISRLRNRAVGALFRKEEVTVAGPLSDYVCQADSGATMHRRFCTRCGTPIFSEAEERPTLIFVRAGTLDDPDLAAPTATIWTKSAPKWACFDPALPEIEGQPPHSKA